MYNRCWPGSHNGNGNPGSKEDSMLYRNLLVSVLVAAAVAFVVPPTAVASDVATVRITDVSTKSPVRDQKLYVSAQLTNTGTSTWAPVGTTTQQEEGKYYCELTIAQFGKPIVRSILALPRAIGPGETVSVEGSITAPTIDGSYVLTAAVLKSFRYTFCDERLRNVEHELQVCPTVPLTVR